MADQKVLKDLAAAFGTRTVGGPGTVGQGPRRRVSVKQPGAAIAATHAAIKQVQKSEGLSFQQAGERLIQIRRELGRGRAMLTGFAAGSAKAGKPSVITSAELGRTLRARAQQAGGGVSPQVISHIISQEQKHPTPGLGITIAGETSRSRRLARARHRTMRQRR